jgi:regulator of RNase E activity RraB
MAAHIGGLLGGFAGALLVARPLGSIHARGSTVRQILLAAAGLAVVVAAWALIPRAVEIQRVFADFQTMERRAIDAYNSGLEWRQANQVSDEDLAKIIDDKVLPPWRAFEVRLHGIGRLPPEQRKRVDALLRYVEMRARGWKDMSAALRSEDPAKLRAAAAHQREAEGALKVLEDGK